jgi:hypothetical protein
MTTRRATLWRMPSARFGIFLGAYLSGCAAAEPPNSNGSAGSAGAPAGGVATGGSTVTAGVSGTSTTAGVSNGGAGAAGQGGNTAAGGGAGGTSSGASPGGGGSGGQAPVPNAVESLSVPFDGQAVTGTVLLDVGALYLLKATGTVDAGGSALDAEYGGFTAAVTGQDSVSGTDVGIDVGFKLERAPQGQALGRKKWFGAYRADHTYYVVVTGSGAALSLKLLRGAGTAGSGVLTVSAFRLSATAPALAAPLETVLANVNKPTVHSTTTTTSGVVYLLQASGSGKVGGANLALGDADWMDYDVNGNGKVDIGDENVDYGLGVDESDPKKTPRLNWWGPWRKDHSYFMLFAGTGNTLGFSYYDVGDYGDNSSTEKLTVRVFAVP